MGKMIFVRHGESVANRDKLFAEEETPLTEIGRRQALETGRSLAARYRPAAIVSSRLRRARETADLIAAELHLPVEIWPGLEEQDFGAFKGKSFVKFGEYLKSLPDANPSGAIWSWKPEGGESTEETQQRVLGALSLLRERHPVEEVVVVCHGMVLLSLWAYWTGDWNTADIPKNCAVIEVEWNGNGFAQPVVVPGCTTEITM
jgi:broad specificity phosphatase PhoE